MNAYLCRRWDIPINLPDQKVNTFRTTKELLKIEAQIKIILFTIIPTQSLHQNELVPPIHCSKDVD